MTDGGGFTLNGRTDYPSELLNERQRERTGFGQLSFLHDSGPLTLQTSLFARFSQLVYSPDETGELLFNGQAQRAVKEDTAGGLQVEGAYRATRAHTLRFGFVFQTERGRSQTTTAFAETQNYYDVGVLQRVAAAPGLSVGVDAYYRESRELIDEGQFGAPIIQTPFNYQKGRIRGVEVNANYARGPWLLYANAAYTRGQGENINTSQFSFDPTELAFIRSHFIFLDHDQTYTASAGLSYNVRDGVLRGLKPSIDMVFGSGLRSDGLEPNGETVPSYVQVNTALSYDFTLPYTGRMQARFDVINLLDEKYEIRDGTGVGVGAPQFGARRGVFGGLTKFF